MMIVSTHKHNNTRKLPHTRQLSMMPAPNHSAKYIGSSLSSLTEYAGGGMSGASPAAVFEDIFVV